MLAVRILRDFCHLPVARDIQAVEEAKEEDDIVDFHDIVKIHISFPILPAARLPFERIESAAAPIEAEDVFSGDGEGPAREYATHVIRSYVWQMLNSIYVILLQRHLHAKKYI